MIESKVPMRISPWSGTGTVLVPLSSRHCITMWLPRWRTCTKPCAARIVQISLPLKMRSLGNGNLDLSDKYVLVQPLCDLVLRRAFEK